MLKWRRRKSTVSSSKLSDNHCSMLMDKSGMVISSNESHPQKANLPMLVTESGIVTCRNESHPQKADCPMLVTEFGIMTCRNDVQQ